MDNEKTFNFLKKPGSTPQSQGRPDRSNRWFEKEPASAGMGKLPPQAIDMEEAVLGALMI